MLDFRRKLCSSRARIEFYPLIQSLLEGNDPVQILHRGQPAAVLVSDAEYRRLLAHVKNPSSLRRGLKGCVTLTERYARRPSVAVPSGSPAMSTSMLIADTEPFLWYAGNRHRFLPPAVLSAFEEAVAGRLALYFPMTLLYELGLLMEDDQIKLNVPLPDLLRERFFARTIEVETIQPQDMMFASLPELPGDFADNIAIAMAIRKRCPLITGNPAIHDANVCQIYW